MLSSRSSISHNFEFSSRLQIETIMKQRIPTQFLQINLARSDEIKNWAERLVKISNESINHDSIPRLMGPPIGISRLTSSYASGEKASGGAIGTCGTATPLQSRGSYARQSPSAHAQASQSEVAATKLNKKSAPVKKVNYTIENAADPNQGEQVIFEIWTNGAISPQDAFAYGIQYAVKLFQQFLPEV